jgi:trehalose-phosphatase
MPTELQDFLFRLASACAATLVLDYDGTLAPFQADREQARPYDGVVERLNRVQAESDTRLVIVTGRAIDHLLPLLALDRTPEIWGSHGWERLRPDGIHEHAQPAAAARSALGAARTSAIADGLAERCEVKPASIACHWRGLPEAQRERLRARIDALWSPLARGPDLDLHAFDGGVELRARGRNKGTAMRDILADQPAGTAVAYLGDDLTDEDAFKALKGHGLGILVRPQARASLADAWIRPPGDLLDFLSLWHAARKGKGNP